MKIFIIERVPALKGTFNESEWYTHITVGGAFGTMNIKYITNLEFQFIRTYESYREEEFVSKYEYHIKYENMEDAWERFENFRNMSEII